MFLFLPLEEIILIMVDRLDIDYKSVGVGEYTPPKSVWEMFGDE